MASTNKTPKLGLNQYVSTDKPTMADYNADMLKIDNSIAGIIGSGSNANGYYVKYSDGTMECYNVLTVTTNASGVASVTFPLAFLTGTEPVVNCDVYATQSITSTKTLQSTTPTGFSIGICTGGVVSASKSHKISYRAISRWK